MEKQKMEFSKIFTSLIDSIFSPLSLFRPVCLSPVNPIHSFVGMPTGCSAGHALTHEILSAWQFEVISWWNVFSFDHFLSSSQR